MSNICPNCGSELQQGALVCRNCRKRIVAVPADNAKKSKNEHKLQDNRTKSKKIVQPDDDAIVNTPVKEQKTAAKEKQKQVSTQPVTKSGYSDLIPNVSVGNWMVSIILTCIPIVGLVFIIVFAFGKNKIKANYFKANLILRVILWVAVIITVIMLGEVVFSWLDIL